MWKFLSVLCVGLFLSACDFFAPSRVLVPTTNVTIEPPSGYEVSVRFPGIEDTRVDGSFTVNIFPAQAVGSLGEMFASVERATPTLNNRGITVEGTETIRWNEKDVLLFRGNQKNDEGVLYEKWIAVFVDERPVMVAFQEPRPGKLSREAIISTFRSVQFDGLDLRRAQ